MFAFYMWSNLTDQTKLESLQESSIREILHIAMKLFKGRSYGIQYLAHGDLGELS